MRHHRHAFTLIEVVAALALIGTSAAMLLTAQSRALAQLSEIRDRARAVRVAEAQIAACRLDPAVCLTEDEGFVNDEMAWRWRRRVRPSSLTRTFDTVEITLEIIRHDDLRGENTLARYVWLHRVKMKEGA